MNSSNIPAGFSFGSSCFGLRSGNTTKDDFSVLYADNPCTVSFVSTRSTFCGEPVKLAREKFVIEKKYRGLALNVGQANVGTGAEGKKTAEKICELVAEKFNCKNEEIFSLSTGVIGQPIDITKIITGIGSNFPQLEPSAKKFSEGMMSTDTVSKTASAKLSSGEIIYGLAKGVGMIEPNMGTMLSVIVTDSDIEPKVQQEIWKRVVEKSYNCVSVDSDTSTSDMAFLFSSGKRKDTDVAEFEEKLLEVCQNLSKQIAKDGEGATKLLEVVVQNCDSQENAKILGKSVINSPLWKSAVFGCDPNWGRILMALGKTQINFDPEKISIVLQGIPLFIKGEIQKFSEKEVSQKMEESSDILLEIDIQTGDKNITVWGCDLSYEYVKINAEYTT